MRRGAFLAVALAVAVAACATERGAAPPPAPGFEGVRSIALVRLREDRGGRRAKDALDGLEESLRARGFVTRVVELEPRAGDAPLQRLYEELRSRALSWEPPPRREAAPPPLRDAGAVIARLGVDAIAAYHRLDRPPASGVPFAPLPGERLPRPGPGRIDGAISLVDGSGRVASVAWGGPSEDRRAPVNAAEAIERVVRTLTGEPEPLDDAEPPDG